MSELEVAPTHNNGRP